MPDTDAVLSLAETADPSGGLKPTADLAEAIRAADFRGREALRKFVLPVVAPTGSTPDDAIARQRA